MKRAKSSHKTKGFEVFFDLVIDSNRSTKHIPDNADRYERTYVVSGERQKEKEGDDVHSL